MQQDTGLNAFIGRGCVDGVYSFDRSPGRPCRLGVLTDTNGLRKLVLACQLVRSDSNPCMAMAPFYLPPETVPVTVATRLHALRISALQGRQGRRRKKRAPSLGPGGP